MTLEESFQHCRRIAKSRARNFYYSFLLLDRERKDAMCAIYAFMRYSDDLSDETAPPLAERKANTRRSKSLAKNLEYTSVATAVENAAQCLGKETAILRCFTDG